MAREPKSFPPLYRAMVAAGESSGTLPTILDRLAALLERQAEIRGKLITALAYPTILAVVALGVVTALMMFVVPQVVEQFDTVGQELPLLTRIVIGAVGLPRRLVVGDAARGRAGAGFVGWRALKDPAIRLRVRHAGCCACRCSAGCCAISTPRGWRARWRRWSRAGCRCSKG